MKIISFCSIKLKRNNDKITDNPEKNNAIFLISTSFQVGKKIYLIYQLKVILIKKLKYCVTEKTYNYD